MNFLPHLKLIKFASYLSVFVALSILCAKTYGWFITGSQAIFASLVDSLLDITSSLINMIVVNIATAPPDHKHRFGHEKFEDLAVFSQSIFFCLSGLFVCISCIKVLLMHVIVQNTAQGINVMLFSLVLTMLLCLYQTYVVYKTNSRIIATDRLHYFSDFLTNIAVIISIMLSHKFWYIDSLIGIGVAFYIIISSYFLFKGALKNLVDQEFEDRDREKILLIISKHKQVKGVHDLKTRVASNKPFIQFHIEIDGNTPLVDAHSLSDEIVSQIKTAFCGAEVIVHHDPYGLEEAGSLPEKMPKKI